MLISFSICHI